MPGGADFGKLIQDILSKLSGAAENAPPTGPTKPVAEKVSAFGESRMGAFAAEQKANKEQGITTKETIAKLGDSHAGTPDAKKEAGLSSKLGEAVELGELGARTAEGDPTAAIELAKKERDENDARTAAFLNTTSEWVNPDAQKMIDEGKAAKGKGEGGGFDFGGMGKEMYGHTVKALGNENELQRFGDVGEGVGGMISRIPGMEKTGEAFGKLSKAVFESMDRVKKWNEQLYEANTRFAQFSGNMAYVQAAQEVREISLSAERGERRASTAKYQAEGKNMLDKDFAAFEDLGAKFTDLISGHLSRLFHSFLGPFPAMANKVSQWIDKVTPDTGKDVDAMEQLRKASNDLAKKGRPNRFGPGGPQP